jgi:site-specific recombinase XerD
MRADARKTRGVFEKVPSSGVWWIRYADAGGRIRREKVGPKGAATQLYHKRKTEVRQRKKLPENFREKPTTFSQLADAALVYSRSHKRSHRDDECRMANIRARFGHDIAEEIKAGDIESWLASHADWMVATRNRYLALIKLTFRLGERDHKIKANPARSVKMQKEDNARVRYLNQYEPLPTKLAYLRRFKDEESRLLAVIRTKYPFHLPEWHIALHTGMRRSEQYGIEWPNVNFERRILTVPRSKHGKARHVPLNSVALAAFESLLPNMATSNFVFLDQHGHEVLQGNRHWFEDTVKEAGLRDFTWHDIRHSFASRLIMRGVGIRNVQELMGHRTIGMTARYTHLEPGQQLAAVETLVGFDSHPHKTAVSNRGSNKRRSVKNAA